MQDVNGLSPKIRVLCVDDCDDVPEMLRRCIDAETDMESVGSLRAADGLLLEVERTGADVVLLDMNMPGKDPTEAMRELLAACRARAARGGAECVRVIAYSGRSDQGSMDLATDAGACGYLSKDAAIPSVLGAIREAARTGTVAKATSKDAGRRGAAARRRV